MKRLPDYSVFPWVCPTPVKPSSFKGFSPGAEKFNIQVSSIEAFGFTRSKINFDSLIYPDRQMDVLVNYPQRPGSGRSGFYRGKYLKGVGRTTLAVGWAGRDFYHNSGHLLPSAAIREYLVTEFMDAKGLANTIVPCEYLLLAPLAKNLKGYSQATFGNLPRELRHHRVDLKMQALTVKPGDFVRASNLIWFLQNMTPQPGNELNLWNFFSLMEKYLQVNGTAKESLRTDLLIEKIIFSIQKTMSHFKSYFKAGIHWNSLQNNYTLDGRFLDLEVASFTSPYFLGISTRENKPTLNDLEFGDFFGLEILTVMKSIFSFYRLMNNRLRFIASETTDYRPAAVDFTKEFCNELDMAVLSGKNSTFRKEILTESLMDMFAENWELGSREKTLLKKIISSRYNREFKGKSTPYPRFATRIRDDLIGRPEPSVQLFGQELILGLRRSGKNTEAAYLNGLFEELCRFKDLDRLLERLRVVRAEIRQEVRR